MSYTPLPNDSGRTYLPWQAEGVEAIQPGETEKIKAVSDQFNRFQKMNFDEHHHMFRGTHLKTQGCVQGTLTIDADLPDHLKQGMFTEAKTFDMMMRYSSLTPKLLPDTAAQPRGLAMKVFGVEGSKIFQTPDQKTQDWTFNNYPLLELRTPQVTNEIADSLERNWNDGDAFGAELGAREDADVACYAGGLAQEHMAAMDQYSQSAYQYGKNVAKLAVFPIGEEQKRLKSWAITPNHPGNILATTLQDFHKEHVATYALCVQLLEDIKEQPVEDIGFIWDAEKYPWQQVGVITIPTQDSFQHSFTNWWNDRITCNSWHGLHDHTPLGSTNRMRKVVYAESRLLRMKFNSTTCIEPSSLAEVPAA